MLWFVSLGEYEVRHNILEERIRKHLCYHIYRYENMGRYKSDLTEEEIDLSNVFIVWSCKTLQNYKSLVSTTIL